QGSFGTNWFAMFEPIRRYLKGIDGQLLQELLGWFAKVRGGPLTQQEQAEVTQIVAKREYPVPFAAMPIQEGIAHTRFLIELVINHHRFAAGAPVVGGRANIGLVTYRGEDFRILES